jgi:hypothetical protein
MSELEFDMSVAAKVTCVRCKRKRPMPEDGDLGPTDAAKPVAIIDTRKACDWNCQETKVRVEITFGF